jgi:O-methyltransferase domain
VPSGADAYVLSHVVHDWPEQQALAILARVREAIPPSGRLLIVEMVMPADDTPHPAHMLDISMMLLTGGEERTEDEYADLLARAGFRLERVIPTRTAVSVLEAIPS